MNAIRALCILPGLWLAACAVVPVPSEDQTLEGRQFTDSELLFIHPGVTTGDEIAGRLGAPTIWFPDQRILVYGLRKTAGTGLVWFVASPSGVAAGGRVQGEEREAVFIALDERGIVTNRGRAPVKRGTSWLGAALAWSGVTGLDVPQPREVFAEIDPAGPGQVMVYFYRPRDNQHYLPLVPPAQRLAPGVADFVNIFLDGVLAGQLRLKTYLALQVTPGEHTFVLSADTDDVVNQQLYRDASLRMSVPTPGSSFIDVRVEAGKGYIGPVLGRRSRAEAIDVIGALRETW